MSYDSKSDTLEHIRRVNDLLIVVCTNLAQRARVHDNSKLVEPEKSTFDACTIKLKSIPYGSDEYKAALAELKPALDHHYAANSHHPEHYANGVCGMSLFDLVEMLMDWKAATERMKDGGDIWRSLEINQGRFKIDAQLQQILENTVREMGWLRKDAALSAELKEQAVANGKGSEREAKLLTQLDKMRAEVEQLRAEVKRLEEALDDERDEAIEAMRAELKNCKAENAALLELAERMATEMREVDHEFASLRDYYAARKEAQP